MKNYLFALCCLLFINPESCFNQVIPYNLSTDSLVNFHAGNRRIYTTTRVVNRPKIDGKLDDSCWLNEGYWCGDFVQQQPQQGRPPSQKTEVKILYDNDNLYVAIRCYDNEPEKISPILGRRDNYNGDMAGIALDTYFDKTTAFEFNVTAAGQKMDLVHLGAYQWDTNWDAVWEGKAHIEDSLWTIEMRIPLSQLRYNNQTEQIWGLHVWRWIDRLKEESQWKLIPIDAPAMVYLFGELHGIKNIKRKRHTEIMPYMATRHFSGGLINERFGYGLDGKIGLTSNFTLDVTALPDFGQVEADPSELNLTSYEVFYDEKRPFFLEGNAILDYSMGGDLIFYSRRIGHAPSYQPQISDDETVVLPAGTKILNAFKLTGKNKKGLSIGIINSMTANEFAEILKHGEVRHEPVEPFTNYFIGRLKQDLNSGNTIIGGMVTSTHRSIKDDHLQFMPDKSVVAGVDIRHNLLNRKYFVDLKTFYSNISGKPMAISVLQRSSHHLFHRPDATHLKYNPDRNILDGWGGQFQGGKQSGRFRAICILSWRSPGVDLNDLGYLRESDIIIQGLNLRYQVNQPKGILQNYYLSLEQRNDWSFGGENLNKILRLRGYLRFNNLWSLQLNGARNFEQIDIRQLRGGPSLRIDPTSNAGFYFQTNSADKIYMGLGADKKWVDQRLGGAIDYTFFLQWRLSNQFTISSRTNYEDLTDNNQYVTQKIEDNYISYIVGRLHRKTFHTTLRVEYFATPELSFQFYGSPYVSVGKFLNFYEVDQNLAHNTENRYLQLTVINETGERYYLKETVNGLAGLSIRKPDFSFQELRSNLVLRWEYRAGSTLYLVWTHNRTSYITGYNPSVLNSLGGISDIKPENAFMLKFSYWFSL